MIFPENLSQLLQQRKSNGNFRELKQEKFQVDFFSNDYLGYSKNQQIYKSFISILKENQIDAIGSTGSRLLSGNHSLFEKVENKAKDFFNAEAALFFNSGYDANTGLLSAVLKPKDLVFYDELCHASIRDGLLMAKSKAYKFKHNDYEDLSLKIEQQGQRLKPQNIFIITESVFSMDGDTSELSKLIEIAEKFKAYLIVDEAHALGVCGKDFKGLSQEFSPKIFARIFTCGKSLGAHGAFVLGSENLKNYLINFCKSFIYTTAASPHQVVAVLAALNYFENTENEKFQLQKCISFFTAKIKKLDLKNHFLTSHTAIQSFKIEGNTAAKLVADKLQQQGFGVKAILHPTVPKGQERIRICLHAFNTKEEMTQLLKNLKQQLS